MMNKILIEKNELIDAVGVYGKIGAAKNFSVSKKTIIRRLAEYGITVYDCKRAMLPDVLTKKQLDFMNGWLLGDGTIPSIKNRLNKSFRFGQKYSNLEYVEFVHSVLRPFSCDVKKDVYNKFEKAFFYTVAHPIFTELRRKWYDANGLKIVPKDLKLNWATVAMWHADDGRSSRGGVYLCTNGFLESDVCFLIERLREDVGVDSNLYHQYDKQYCKSYPMIYVKANSYKKFFASIKRYLSKIVVLEYKLYHTWNM